MLKAPMLSPESSLRLILVRHGETVGNSSIRYYGRTDLALSELGRAQMRSAARWLAAKFGRDQFEAVFSSPLARACESARLIAGASLAPIQIIEFLEVDFGLFEGLTAEEIAEHYPDEFRRWNRDRLAPDYTYPGGETRADFTARVNQGVDRMLSMLDRVGQASACGTQPVALLVAHRGVIRTITQSLAGLMPQIEIGSIQVLRAGCGGHQWQAEILDVTEHL
jgi:broad specificity phosphatase PhoE